ncbi:unnamed protein product [Sphagnum troendelagicum]
MSLVQNVSACTGSIINYWKKNMTLNSLQEMRFLGMTEEEMRHPLVTSLVELWPDYNDFYIDLDNLAHPLVVDVAANVDLGVPITVGQLLQLHPFLHQACNILDVELPHVFI